MESNEIKPPISSQLSFKKDDKLNSENSPHNKDGAGKPEYPYAKQ